MIRIKEILKKNFNDADLSKGIKRAILNPFYHKGFNTFYDNNHGLFPYRSIKFLIKSLDWPSDYTSLRDYPKEANVDWSNEVNGVANDGNNWYIIQNNMIWKFPIAHSLTDTGDVDKIGIPDELHKKGYNHFGDSSYFDHPTMGGLLFVPMEGVATPIGTDDEGNYIYGPVPPPRILLYAVSGERMIYLDSIPLFYQEVGADPKQLGGAPWCALNPITGVLYTSEFDGNFLYAFEPVYNVGGDIFDVIYRGKFQLKAKDGSDMDIKAIQGGAFSKNGHLYLSSDRAFWSKSKSDVQNSGIYGFDMISGKNIKHIIVDYEPTISMPWPLEDAQNQELEGMDIWNLGSEWGQIHIMLNDNEPSHDDIFFKHFRVPSGEEDKI